MPSAITHFIIGASIAAPIAVLGSRDSGLRPAALAVSAGVVATIPDLDAALFGVIPYAHFFGHRGFFHSSFFLVGVSFVLTALVIALGRGVRAGDGLRMLVAFSLAGVSHSLLDAMSDAGLGVMLAYPVSKERIFLPWRPLYTPPVSVGIPSRELLWRLARHELPIVAVSLAASVSLSVARLAWRKKKLNNTGCRAPSPDSNP